MLAQIQHQGSDSLKTNSSSVGGKYLGVYDEHLISKTINNHHTREENNSN